MGVQEAGVYWPFKSLLQGSGIVLTETSTGITIATTGAGPGGGDMLISVFATNGSPGVVDKAVSAQTVTGVVAHATLADTCPWGGLIGAPTVFPSDWGSISNKPATFTPSPHAPSHVSGNDVIPVATTSLPGLRPALSGKSTDYAGGDGLWHDLNTTVGSYPLTMTAALVCNGGFTMAGGGGLQVSGGPITATGNNPTGANTVASAGLVLNNTNWVIDGKGQSITCGIYDTGTGTAGLSLGNGATGLNVDSVLLYKPSGLQELWEAYYDATGKQVYAAQILNTYNPTGLYSMRATTRLAGTCDLPGNNTAWSLAPFLAQSQTNGGFAGYGMVCQNYWGCCLGAWQSGLFIATSANTFVQLTDANGRILGSALQAGAAVANIGYTPQPNLGYTPLNRAGDTMTGQLTMQNASIYLNGGLISMLGNSGYQWAIEVSGANLYAVRVNDGYTKQLAP